MFYNYPKKTESEVREDSKQAAERDLQAGCLGIRTFGLIRGPDLYKQAWKERGIDCRIIAGDIVDNYIFADAGGYNGVMYPEIEKLFGKNIFQEVRDRHNELRAEWRAEEGKRKAAEEEAESAVVLEEIRRLAKSEEATLLEQRDELFDRTKC